MIFKLEEVSDKKKKNTDKFGDINKLMLTDIRTREYIFLYRRRSRSKAQKNID